MDEGTPVDLHRAEPPQRLPGPQGAEAFYRKRLPWDDERQTQTHWPGLAQVPEQMFLQGPPGSPTRIEGPGYRPRLGGIQVLR